jgi:hypothetical protein
VNNYLAGIAARTLNPDPPVRPRLPGRFEPASVLHERSIDSSESLHPATAKPSQSHSERDHLAAREPTDRPASVRQPGNLIDPPSRAHRAATATREMNRPPASPVLDHIIEPSSLMLRSSNRQTVAEPAPPTLNVETPRVTKVVDVSRNVESPGKTPPAPRGEHNVEPRVERIAGKSAHLHHRAADEIAQTISRPEPKRKKPQPGREYEEKDVAQPIRRQKTVIERELQTVTIRGKPRPSESERRNESKSPLPPTTGVTPPAMLQHDNPKPPPVFIPSRIAPMIEVEPLGQSRSEPQPTVHVTIGRLEVRAVQTSQPAAKPRAAAPVMNLDDYLKRRSQGGAQ